jgi:hypothetical protein
LGRHPRLLGSCLSVRCYKISCRLPTFLIENYTFSKELKERHRIMKNQLLILVIVMTMTALSLSAVATEVTLQYGQNGYTGSMDTWVLGPLDGNDSGCTNCYGSSTYLASREQPHRKPLIAFDISSIPINAVIDTATLSFYLISNDNGFDTMHWEAHKMLTDWEAGTGTGSPTDNSACWYYSNYDSTPSERVRWITWNSWYWPYGPWANLNHSMWESATSADMTDTINTWIDFNATDVVQSWIDFPYDNRGWIIWSDDGANPVQFASNEYATQGYRPKLTINYHITSQTTSQTVLQEGLDGDTGVVQDTYLWENTSYDNGGATSLGSNVNAEYLPLVKFDVSSIPAEMTVISATLSLYMAANTSGADTVSWVAKKMLMESTFGTGVAQAVDNTVSYLWRNYNSNAALRIGWRADESYCYGPYAGESYSTTDTVNSDSASDTNNVWITFDVTDMTQGWVTNSSTNHGVILYPGSGFGEAYVVFHSSEYATQGYRPKLTINYKKKITFQEGLDSQTGVVKDTYLWENTSYDNGGATYLGSNSDVDYLPLVKFDISSISEKSTVISATLSLYMAANTSGADTVNWVAKKMLMEGTFGTGVTQAVDNTVSYLWRNYNSNEALRIGWRADESYCYGPYAGESYSTTDTVNSDPAPGANNVWITFDVTDMAQGWIRDSSTNHGVILYPGSGLGEAFVVFHSSEYATQEYRPKLEVDYCPVPFDKYNNILFDGNPVYPQMVDKVIDQDDFDTIAGLGYNTIEIPISEAGKSLLDAAEDSGLMVFVDIGAPTSSDIETWFDEIIVRIRQCKNHPNILAWQNCDEPSEINPDYLSVAAFIDIYQQIKAEDPYHLVLGNFSRVPGDEKWQDGVDMFGVEPYPIWDSTKLPAGPVQMVYKEQMIVKDTVSSSKVRWGTTQAFGNEGSWGREPTGSEYYIMRWLHVLGGAKMVTDYTWYSGTDTSVYTMKTEDDLQDSATQANSELELLAPKIMQASDWNRVTNGEIYCGYLDVEDKYYILIANTSYDTTAPKVTVTGVTANAKWQDFFDTSQNLTITDNNTTLNLNLTRYGVRCIELSDTASSTSSWSLSLLGDCGDTWTNLTLTATVTSSGQVSSEYADTKAIDDNWASRWFEWRGASGTNWIKLTWGSSVQMDRVYVTVPSNWFSSNWKKVNVTLSDSSNDTFDLDDHSYRHLLTWPSTRTVTWIKFTPTEYHEENSYLGACEIEVFKE